MAKGTVKFFNAQKGYGFIVQDAGGPDVFVHISAVERAGMSTLNEGQKAVLRRRGRPPQRQERRRQSAGDLNHNLNAAPAPYWRRCFRF